VNLSDSERALGAILATIDAWRPPSHPTDPQPSVSRALHRLWASLVDGGFALHNGSLSAEGAALVARYRAACRRSG
jgi:hypothetical protein